MTAAWTLTDLTMFKSELRWSYRLPYVEYFAPDGPTPTPGPTLREWLIADGFWADEVDAYLARKEERAAEMERQRAEMHHRAAAREALERTWRFRTRRWITTRRDRIRMAWAVLRDEHECEEKLW